jgi:chromosome segregation ATPase
MRFAVVAGSCCDRARKGHTLIPSPWVVAIEDAIKGATEPLRLQAGALQEELKTKQLYIEAQAQALQAKQCYIKASSEALRKSNEELRSAAAMIDTLKTEKSELENALHEARSTAAKLSNEAVLNEKRHTKLVEWLPLGAFSEDERAVMYVIWERFDKARKHYGALNIATDARNFKHEGLLERIDGIVYDAINIVKEQREHDAKVAAYEAIPFRAAK